MKYGRKNACSDSLAASFGDPVLCPGLMGVAQKCDARKARDETSCEISMTAAANATEAVARA
jgi:hypothetical protein